MGLRPMKSPGIFRLAALLLLGILQTASLWAADSVQYVEPSKPYGASPFLKNARKGPVNASGPLLIPLITWAADGVTVAANNGLDPTPDSPLARGVGRPVKLEVIDDFDKQVENYVTGKSAFLRGTADMIALVAQALKNVDPSLEPVVIFQLSTSTGADGFVAKGINKVADLKGKTIVAQINGPHLSLIGNMLKDAGLSTHDVDIKFVSDITAAPDWNSKNPATDPANAFRRDPQLSGATCISPDILALTGGTEGTGREETVKGARAIFTTKTASKIIFDVYAVRRDFLEKNPAIVKGFREKHLDEQEYFLSEVANIEKKKDADKNRITRFKSLCKPLAKIFNQDEGAIGDYIVWVGSDLQLAGRAGNSEFFNDANPVGFKATTSRIQDFFKELGLIDSPTLIAVSKPGTEIAAAASAPAPLPQPVETAGGKVLFSYAFRFPAQTSEINWKDYVDVFAQIHEIVSRYGGAGIELRGHADNFFYNFVAAKQAQGKTTYQRKNEAGVFETLPLPNIQELLKDADSLSAARAEAVKNAYRQYVQENFKSKTGDLNASRFNTKGLGVNDPLVKNPATPDDRAKNMRTDMIIVAVESELPSRFGKDDLQ